MHVRVQVVLQINANKRPWFGVFKSVKFLQIDWKLSEKDDFEKTKKWTNKTKREGWLWKNKKTGPIKIVSKNQVIPTKAEKNSTKKFDFSSISFY